MNKNNENINSSKNTSLSNTFNKILTGKPGSLIIKAPVVLCNCSFTCPIEYNFRLHSNAIYNKITESNLLINTCEYDRHKNIVSITGLSKKTIKTITLNKNKENPLYSRSTTITIPIKQEIPVKFSESPIYNTALNSTSFKYMDNEIYCEIPYKNVINESFTKCKNKKAKNMYSIKFDLELEVMLLQNQKVFIPEPDGNVYISSKNTVQKCDNSNIYIEIGEDSNKRLIGYEKNSY